MENTTEKKTVYLGDGLYYEFDGFQVRLFAHNGITSSDEVFLEDTVLNALIIQLRRDNLIT